jgi:two-component system, OmpR family, response regulator
VNLAAAVVAVLRTAGIEAEVAHSGAEALALAAGWQPELVLLDAGLPDLDGLDVLRALRTSGVTVPVLFLSARRALADKVRALDAGAADYLVKPFHFEELLARMRVAFRSGGVPGQSRWAIGHLVLDDRSREVTVAGAAVHLSPTEYKLLLCLMRNAGRVVTRGQLYDEVWGFDFGNDSAIIDTFISRVRRKVDAGGAGLIATVRGEGFVIRLPH